MSRRFVSFGVVALVAAFATQFAGAQAKVIANDAQNHWAYVAVTDLANRGLVKGYTDAKFLDGHEMTSFEFASIVNRVLESVSDLAAVHDKNGKPTVAFSNDTLNEIQALTDKFQDELTAIQADVKKAQDDLDALRSDVEDAKDLANKTRLDSYGSDGKRKYSITGYLQTRFDSAGNRNTTKFPRGAAASSSGYNGNYMQGGSAESFVLRRSRLKFQGQVSNNTKYTIQLDAGGLTNGTNQAVTVREGNIAHTLGDGSSANPTLTAGLFANPFGYELPLSSASIISPERPLAFNENGEGLWTNQDYDRGFMLSYGPQQTKYTLAFVNGSGRTTNDTDNTIDTIARISYQNLQKTFSGGVSFYNGHISYVASPAPIRKKQLYGIDAQYNSPSGAFVNAEYVGGKFEQRSWFDQPTLKLTTAAAPGNKVQGYYVTGGLNMGQKSMHPWSIALQYDVFKRSSSGATGSGSNWDDVNFGGGVTYSLDSATRLRFWYVSPTRVAHPSANPNPPKTGLFTTELQVKF